MIESTYAISNKFGDQIYFFLLFVTTNSRTFRNRAWLDAKIPNIRESGQSEKSGSGDIYFLDANFVQFLSCDMWSSIVSLNFLGRWQNVKPKGVRGRLRGLVSLRQTLSNIRDWLGKDDCLREISHMVASHVCLLLARHAILPKPCVGGYATRKVRL